MMIKQLKILIYTFSLFILFSCVEQKNLDFDSSEIIQIEVYKGYPETEVKMKVGFEQEFIKDLNASKYIGATKFMKTHKFIIHKTNGNIDTIITNGTIHQYKGWYKSTENLIEKHAKE